MVIDFEKEREFRVISNGRLWERLLNHCIQTIESCMGEVLPCIAEEEERIMAELRRRKTVEANEIRSAYQTLRLITINQSINQLTNKYKEVINVSSY